MSELRNAVILHAQRGGGKTTTALDSINKARIAGYRVTGILSQRVFLKKNYPGYDVLDLKKGETFPLVRPKDNTSSRDWDSLGNQVYNFSTSGFVRVNDILLSTSDDMTLKTIIFVDEYGRVESSHRGLYSGLLGILESKTEICTIVILCRDDFVEEVSDLVKKYVDQIFVIKAGDPESLWNIIQNCYTK